MKDQLKDELNRFAYASAQAGKPWSVTIDAVGGRVFVDNWCYDAATSWGCGALIFWLLNEFPEVDLEVYRFWNGTACRRVSTSTPAKSGYFAGCTSDDAPLHHVALHQVLLVVNMILEAEAKSE